MDKAFRLLATLSNILVWGFFIFALTELRLNRGPELMMALALFFFPLFNLLALYCGPDRETRQLRRAVEKARLKKALQDLTEGKSPSLGAEKGGCCSHS